MNGLKAGGIHEWEKCHRPQGLIDNTVLLMVMRTRHSSAFSGMTERDSARGGGGNMKITKKSDKIHRWRKGIEVTYDKDAAMRRQLCVIGTMQHSLNATEAKNDQLLHLQTDLLKHHRRND